MALLVINVCQRQVRRAVTVYHDRGRVVSDGVRSIYWWYPIGIIARLTLLVVVAALFALTHMLPLPSSRPGGEDDDRS